jgi:hypothetical protein
VNVTAVAEDDRGKRTAIELFNQGKEEEDIWFLYFIVK